MSAGSGRRGGRATVRLEAPERTVRVDGLPAGGELDLCTRAIVQASAAGDVAIRTVVASALTASMLPWAALGGPRAERADLAVHARLAAAQEATETFPAPPRDIEVRTAYRRPGPAGATVDSLRFDSPYEAASLGLRKGYASLAHNRVACARHWRHEDGPRPTLCVIHGFGASPHWFNSLFFSLPSFFADGYDVLLYVLPLHGARASRWPPVNGSAMFSGGLARFNEAILHAVHDFRVLVDHLLRQGSEHVAVTGLSLGGYVSALLAAVEPRLCAAIPNAPVTSVPGLLAEWFPAGLLLRIAEWGRMIAIDDIEAALAVHSPLNYAPVLPSDRLMIIGGLGDRLAPPEQARLLWEHWGRPRLHWYPGNHTVHIRRSAYLDEMRDFLRGCAPQ